MTDTTEGPRGIWRWWPLRFLLFVVVMMGLYIGCQIGRHELPRRLPMIPAPAAKIALTFAGIVVLVLAYRVLVRVTERRSARELGASGAFGGFLRGALIGV